jgi:hypothetical protein
VPIRGTTLVRGPLARNQETTVRGPLARSQ